MNETAITFQGILNKITTTLDGGWTVSFSISQSDADQILELSSLRNETLQIAVLTSAMILNKYEPAKAEE